MNNYTYLFIIDSDITLVLSVFRPSENLSSHMFVKQNPVEEAVLYLRNLYRIYKDMIGAKLLYVGAGYTVTEKYKCDVMEGNYDADSDNGKIYILFLELLFYCTMMDYFVIEFILPIMNVNLLSSIVVNEKAQLVGFLSTFSVYYNLDREFL